MNMDTLIFLTHEYKPKSARGSVKEIQYLAIGIKDRGDKAQETFLKTRGHGCLS
jgi:hypothetical protein